MYYTSRLKTNFQLNSQYVLEDSKLTYEDEFLY